MPKRFGLMATFCGLLLATGAVAKPKPQAPSDAPVLVQIGRVHNATRVRSERVMKVILDESRRKLEALPGIDVVDTAPASSKEPLVLVMPNVRQLEVSREGSSVRYSASIEYVMHAMPDQSIMASVSGRASTTASLRDARDKTKNARYSREVIDAAIESALRRAPPALRAAARL